MDNNELLQIGLGVLLVISEGLSLTTRFKSNGVIQLVYNVLKVVMAERKK